MSGSRWIQADFTSIMPGSSPYTGCGAHFFSDANTLSYISNDGTARVIPVGYFWTGDEFVISSCVSVPRPYPPMLLTPVSAPPRVDGVAHKFKLDGWGAIVEVVAGRGPNLGPERHPQPRYPHYTQRPAATSGGPV
jgi:hypothetical protein